MNLPQYKHGVFVCLHLPHSTQVKMASLSNKCRNVGLSGDYVREGFSHITLKYLGKKVSPILLSKLKNFILPPLTSFKLPKVLFFNTIELFVGHKNQLVIAFSVEPYEPLNALHQYLEKATVELGGEPDKWPTFKAHSTLGYLDKDGEKLAKSFDFSKLKLSTEPGEIRLGVTHTDEACGGTYRCLKRIIPQFSSQNFTS